MMAAKIQYIMRLINNFPKTKNCNILKTQFSNKNGEMKSHFVTSMYLKFDIAYCATD